MAAFASILHAIAKSGVFRLFLLPLSHLKSFTACVQLLLLFSNTLLVNGYNGRNNKLNANKFPFLEMLPCNLL